MCNSDKTRWHFSFSIHEGGGRMTFLSIKDETCEALKLLRHKGETDDALIKRIVDLARCYMILFGMEDEKTNAQARAP